MKVWNSNPGQPNLIQLANCLPPFQYVYIARVAIDPNSEIRTTKKRVKHTCNK